MQLGFLVNRLHELMISQPIVHAVTNIGMNMGMMPIIGVTLPLVSYGGSSLVTNFILLGMVSSIGYENKKRRTLEIV